MQDPELDGLGVFASAPPASYEDAVEHLQRIHDDAAINALLERMDAEQAEAEVQKHMNNAPGSVAADRRPQIAATRSKQRSQEQGQATAVCTCTAINVLQAKHGCFLQLPSPADRLRTICCLQGGDIIDLCDSDAEDTSPSQRQPKRSCSAARIPAGQPQAAASTSGRPQSQHR